MSVATIPVAPDWPATPAEVSPDGVELWWRPLVGDAIRDRARWAKSGDALARLARLARAVDLVASDKAYRARVGDEWVAGLVRDFARDFGAWASCSCLKRHGPFGLTMTPPPDGPAWDTDEHPDTGERVAVLAFSSWRRVNGWERIAHDPVASLIDSARKVSAVRRIAARVLAALSDEGRAAAATPAVKANASDWALLGHPRAVPPDRYLEGAYTLRAEYGAVVQVVNGAVAEAHLVPSVATDRPETEEERASRQRPSVPRSDGGSMRFVIEPGGLAAAVALGLVGEVSDARTAICGDCAMPWHVERGPVSVDGSKRCEICGTRERGRKFRKGDAS